MRNIKKPRYKEAPITAPIYTKLPTLPADWAASIRKSPTMKMLTQMTAMDNAHTKVAIVVLIVKDPMTCALNCT